jgi:Rha family phage regulatory protein
MNQVATRTNVLIIDGQAFTTSIDVATIFGRNHKDVLRKIVAIGKEMPEEMYERNFAPIQIDVDLGMGRTRQDTAYRLTRDGFVLLAMGFTGKQAFQFKLAYIEEFNRMEAALRGEYAKLSPAQRRDLQNAVSTRAYAMGGSREDFATVYRILKDHFKVPTYADIPASGYAEAMSLIDTTQPNVLRTDMDKVRYIVKQADALSKRVYALYGAVDVETFTLAQDLRLRLAFAPEQYRPLAIA